jgi:hypothetical protein
MDYVGHVFSIIPIIVRPSPMLCSHLRQCAAIPMLWRPVLTRHRHVGACATRALLCGKTLDRHGCTLDRRTDDDQAQTPVKTPLEVVPRQAQESPHRPQKSKFAINSRQRQRFTRTTITPGALYASTPLLCVPLCSMLVAASPWPIKGGRRPVAGTLERIRTHTHSTHFEITPLSHPDIGTCLNHPSWDLEASPPEMNRFSANRNPTLSTSVVIPRGLPRAIPCLSNTKNPYRRKQIKYNIYLLH